LTIYRNEDDIFNPTWIFEIRVIGTISKLLAGKSHPQDVVVPNNPVPGIKTQEDNL